MINRSLDVVAIGSCYVDTNTYDFPFDRNDLATEEIVGSTYEVVPGGSAVNFCRLGQDLGLRTAFIGMSGTDVNGDTLESLLTQQGVRATLIRRSDLLTNIGFNITTPDGEHTMFVAGTANAALSPDAVMPHLEEILPEVKVLYLGGCFKLQAFSHAFKNIVALAKQHDTKIAVDHGRIPKGTSHEMLEAVRALALGAAYYFPSRTEFCELWDVADIDNGLHKLTQLAPGLTVIVKDGANGAFYSLDGAIQHAEAENVEKVANATGAGDSFNAGVIAALAKEQSLVHAVAYGCKVAAAKIKSTNLPSLY